eukprot:TRINITY_DN8331_c0_g2_i1.p1 TRINITY_DN8331_c0_g2~~TRINITY_DN8331_c0_g2_i1.p1  ORF type:complete len:577 (+),score=219.44 TRINITY_DN8331_c0_g2_i1:46-1731(+)
MEAAAGRQVLRVRQDADGPTFYVSTEEEEEPAQGGCFRRGCLLVAAVAAAAVLAAVRSPRRRGAAAPPPPGRPPPPADPPSPQPPPAGPCVAAVGGVPELPRPAVSGICLPHNYSAPDAVWAGGGHGVLVCAGRGGEFTGSGPGAVYHLGGPGYWKECVHSREPPLPPFRVPAAVKALGGACPSATAAGVLSALRAAAPASPEAVVVTAADKALDAVPHHAKIAIAATVVWSLAHGVKHLFYTLRGSCYRAGGPGWEVSCWQGGWWVHHAWVKPLALVTTFRRYGSVAWVLSVDTDAVPRHLGWGVADVAAAAAAQALPDESVGGDVQDGAGLAELPNDTAVVGAREPVLGVRFNTGVLLFRGGAGDLARDWWAARDDDCARADCPSRGWCEWHGRLAAPGDQKAFNTGVWARQGRRMRAVPMVLMNSHSGLMVAHCFSKKSWATDALFTEVMLRHAGGVMALSGCSAPDPCLVPKAVSASASLAHNCTQPRARAAVAWRTAALAAVEEVDMSEAWAADRGRMSGGCASTLSRRLREEAWKWSRHARAPPPPRRTPPRRRR